MLKDVTAVGVLSASPALAATIAAYASGAVDPRPLVAATVGLEQVAAVLAGDRPGGRRPRPQDPRRPPHRLTGHQGTVACSTASVSARVRSPVTSWYSGSATIRLNAAREG